MKQQKKRKSGCLIITSNNRGRQYMHWTTPYASDSKAWKFHNNSIFKVCINMGSIIFSSGGFVGRFISILPPLPTMSVSLSRLARALILPNKKWEEEKESTEMRSNRKQKTRHVASLRFGFTFITFIVLFLSAGGSVLMLVLMSRL